MQHIKLSFGLQVCFSSHSRFQLIEDLSYEDVKKCYRGSVSLPSVFAIGTSFLPNCLIHNNSGVSC